MPIAIQQKTGSLTHRYPVESVDNRHRYLSDADGRAGDDAKYSLLTPIIWPKITPDNIFFTHLDKSTLLSYNI